MVYEIEGGFELNGEVQISGSKNAALPIIISSLLSPNALHLSRIPRLKDIDTTLKILKKLGVSIQNDNFGSIHLSASAIVDSEIDDQLVNSMRASVLVLGPLLTRFGEVKIALPGGCAIGKRPIDLHIAALQQMGAEIEITDQFVIAKARKLKGTTIDFKKVTVTGTCNVIMAAVLAEGVTTILNAAKEPEVVDLIHCLNSRGAQIKGAGESFIQIKGVKELCEISYEIIPDRIETATYLVAGAITGGKLTTLGTKWQHLQALIETFEKTGLRIEKTDQTITVFPLNKNRFQPTHIKTAPYPEFATDLHPLYAVIDCYAQGVSTIEENIFENRFCYLNELHKMGASFEVTGNTAKIRGVSRLQGSELMVADLRAGAALVLASLSAEGKSVIHHTQYIERGYEDLESKLTALGADIKINPIGTNQSSKQIGL